MTNRICDDRRARVLLLSAALAPLLSLNAAQAEKRPVVLHAFNGNLDGSTPGAGLTRGPDGTLYGVTEGGGAGDNSAGTLYKITPDGKEIILYAFQYCCNGANPSAEPALDDKGNLYGTACCVNEIPDYGVVYKLAPDGTYTVLHSFAHGNESGEGTAGVALDKKGNVYGVAYVGGTQGDGVLYKISPEGAYTVLHNFAGDDGNFPTGTPLLDKQGNIFGTTQRGGQYNSGVIYKLTPDGTETVLYSFKPQTDGASPRPGVVRDNDGNLYGTTQMGGAYSQGTLFEYSASGAFTVLHAFAGGANDGWGVASPPTIVRDGNGKTELFGVTTYGGKSNYGTAYKLSANGHYKIIFNFNQNGPILPVGRLVADPSGKKLYGASNQGGGTGCIGYGCGTVFELH